MGRHIVGKVGDLLPGERKVVEAEGRSIGVFNVGGNFYGLRNSCPHQAAPLCLGSVKGMTMPSKPGEYAWAREGEILRCPWHGWEFDLRTGKSWCEPDRTKVRSFDLKVETGGALVEGELQAETFPVVIEKQYVVIEV
jgi:nitrite reductase/ring-hydroxylating ferredoxin subunit